MAEADRIKALEMRIVQLENQVKALQPATGTEEITADDFDTYQKVGTALGWIYFCTSECRPIIICRPLNKDFFAQLARISALAAKQSK